MAVELTAKIIPPPLEHGSVMPPRVSMLSTPEMLRSLLAISKDVSDIIFSPARPPQVVVAGGLLEVKAPGMGAMTSEDTRRIATELIGRNAQARQALETQGSCDLSHGVEGLARFRANIFKQRGSYAIVLRVIAPEIPTFESLNLPAQLAEIVSLKSGIVLVTGPTGSGKSSTLAALIDRINEQKPFHIVTIEDPIEFLHPHKKATIHQREVHSDAPSFDLALRAALRQAPNVILVGEMRDRETMEVALEAAETGHLVFSTMHTIDASKTVERITGVFPLEDQELVRLRLSKTFRYIISQRLIETKDGRSRVGVFEILKSTLRTREYIQKGESEGRSLLDAMRDGNLEGMQYFDAEIEKLIRAGKIALETGLTYATNPGNLRLQLHDLIEAETRQATPRPVRITRP